MPNRHHASSHEEVQDVIPSTEANSKQEPQEQSQIPEPQFTSVQEAQIQFLLHSSSPNETVVSEDSSPVQDDYRTHQQLLRRVAISLDIQIDMAQESSHRLLDTLGSSGPSKIALPANKTILKPTKPLYQMPSSLSLTANRTERRHHTPSQGYEHLYTCPSQGSLVVSAVNERASQG
ncbi:cytochrome c oxidase subunit 6A1, mitochondrial [Platysternon megacephalum]|uniref:Cytochrome c oxidase subunit 6A1, mitochondrial n=1 Tax=Platysternon megacephalum TaxID=55544 RepID=A0A4D9E2E6_9SAUR|nr:cytochrome c oxidase subunit 6A1, mitochondrial [Platysternon megacephalum]